MFLWSYTDRLAGRDDGWWRAATRRTAEMLEDGHWWVDETETVPPLLVDTTALLGYAIARSRDEDPAAVTGATLVGWTMPRIAGLQLLAEQLFRQPPEDATEMWAWHRAFGREWRATVQQVAYLLVAAGHELPIEGHGGPVSGDPVLGLWRDLVERADPRRRYASVAGPALIHGLTELVRHFGRPAHR